MYLEQLVYFAKIAEHGSFSKASRALFISQPALSMAMNNFEAELGYTLFRRTPQGAVLTELGQEALSYTLDIFCQLESMKHLAERTDSLYGHVKIMAFPGFYNTMADQLYLNLRESSPGIQLTVTETSPQRILEDLANGEYALAVSGSLEETMGFHDVSLKRYRLEELGQWDDQLVALLPTSHPLAKKATLGIRDLDGERLLVFDQHLRNGVPVFFDRLDNPPNLTEVLEFPDGKLLQAALANGLGIAFIPANFVYKSPYVESGALTWRPIEGIEHAFKHFLVCRNNTRLNALEDRVIEEINSLYRDAAEARQNVPKP